MYSEMQDSQAEDVCWVLDQVQKWVFLSAPRWLIASATNGYVKTCVANSTGHTESLQAITYRCAARVPCKS